MIIISEEADKKFKSEMRELFAEIERTVGSPLPASPICEIDSQIAEDGKTLTISIDLEDGSTQWISLCPGLPIKIHQVVSPTATESTKGS